VGLAAAILIGLFVRDEFSYDSFIPGHQRVFRVATIASCPAGARCSFRRSADLAAWMKLDFRGTERRAPWKRTVGLRHGNFRGERDIAWADPDVLEVLRSSICRESTDGFAAAGRDRSDEANGTQVFGRDNPIGESIEINRSIRCSDGSAHGFALQHAPRCQIFCISAPHTRALPCSTPCRDRRAETLEYIGVHPFVPAASIDELAHACPTSSIGICHFPARQDQRSGTLRSFDTAIHLYTPGSATGDYALAAIGALTVLLASLNFVNLTTARATRRAIESHPQGSGAGRSDLVIQFIVSP